MNKARITEKQQVVYGIIIETNQVILFVLILSLWKCKISIAANTYNSVAGDAHYNATKVGKNKTEVFIPLKDFSNFWRTLNIPLINCEIELILTWSKNYVLANMISAITGPTGLEFQIID